MKTIPCSQRSHILETLLLCLVCAIAYFLATDTAQAQPSVGSAEPVAIGSRVEVFFDDWLIEDMTGVELKLHHPQRKEVVLRFDEPWEGNVSGYVGVFRDQHRFRMYYRGTSGKRGSQQVTCYAESLDGIHWTKPSLHLCEFAGSKENNIVFIGPAAHNFAVFKDDNPATDPTHRYKAVGSEKRDGKPVLMAFVSPDGFEWQPLQEDPIITRGAFDSLNTVGWDRIRQCYVAFVRDFVDGIRHIRCATSTDFINWTEPRVISFGDAPAEHLYTNAIVPYFRAPHVYIGLPMRFQPDRRFIPTHPHKGAADAVFMCSRSLFEWDRRFLEAFIRPGPDQRNWTDRANMPAWGILPTSETEISVYWSEHYRATEPQLCRGTVRTDGFVSVHAPYAGGTFTTRLFTFAGSELMLNYATSAAGAIRIEILDEQNQPVPGFSLKESLELYGDEIDRAYTWKDHDSVSALAGKPVRLRVTMKDADLYAIQFRD